MDGRGLQAPRYILPACPRFVAEYGPTGGNEHEAGDASRISATMEYCDCAKTSTRSWKGARRGVL